MTLEWLAHTESVHSEILREESFMYIWRVNKLADEFKSGRVTERQQLYYLLAFIGLTTIACDPYVSDFSNYELLNILDILMLPANLVIAIVGTILCYKVSEPSESGVGLLPRYICLGLPISIRMIVAVFAAMIFVFIINDYVFTIPEVDNYLGSEQTTLVDFVGIILFQVFFFWYLRRAIRSSY